MLNYQLSGGLFIFSFFWIPYVAGLVMFLAVIGGSYFMLKTFYTDKRYGWLAAYSILVVLPFLLGQIISSYGIISVIISLLPLLAFFLLSMLLKYTINDWMEEAHFKALRLKEKALKKAE